MTGVSSQARRPVLPVCHVSAALLVIVGMAVGSGNWGGPPSHMTQNVATPAFGDAAGHLYSCAGDAAHNFTFSFLPHDVRMGHFVLASGAMTPAVEFLSSGTLCYEAFVPWSPDPIYKNCMTFTCKDVNAIVKGLCPLQKGKSVSFSNVQYLVQTNVTVTPAPYSINGTIFNDLEELLVCFKGIINVVK